jgi:hypothetical protein
VLKPEPCQHALRCAGAEYANQKKVSKTKASQRSISQVGSQRISRVIGTPIPSLLLPQYVGELHFRSIPEVCQMKMAQTGRRRKGQWKTPPASEGGRYTGGLAGAPAQCGKEKGPEMGTGPLVDSQETTRFRTRSCEKVAPSGQLKLKLRACSVQVAIF